jgi:peroxiredoxin
MVPLGTAAPAFSLPDTTGRRVTLDDLAGAPALVVVFLCNQSPSVQHLRLELARFGRDAQRRGVAIVGINSNDVAGHPEDSPQRMGTEAREAGYTFPYLSDETQSVAKAYGATCTPDFFLFDASRRLVYRGRFDGSRPGDGQPATGTDLRRAMECLLGGRPVDPDQFPSIGSALRWKPGNGPKAGR